VPCRARDFIFFSWFIDDTFTIVVYNDQPPSHASVIDFTYYINFIGK
jgi:hypothetical protein